MRMYMRCCKNMIPFQQPRLVPALKKMFDIFLKEVGTLFYGRHQAGHYTANND